MEVKISKVVPACIRDRCKRLADRMEQWRRQDTSADAWRRARWTGSRITRGRDAVRRFFLLSRKVDTEFVFDVDLAREAERREPGVLRAVRPCPHLLDLRGLGQGANWARPACSELAGADLASAGDRGRGRRLGRRWHRAAGWPSSQTC